MQVSYFNMVTYFAHSYVFAKTSTKCNDFTIVRNELLEAQVSLLASSPCMARKANRKRASERAPRLTSHFACCSRVTSRDYPPPG